MCLCCRCSLALTFCNTTNVLQIKQNLGLDQAKACFTAAAPIAIEVLQYFASLDLPIFEVRCSDVPRLLTSAMNSHSYHFYTGIAIVYPIEQQQLYRYSVLYIVACAMLQSMHCYTAGMSVCAQLNAHVQFIVSAIDCYLH
jgi:hypothetical protein